MSPPEDHPRSLGHFATRIFWTVLSLPVAYVLSYGPATVVSCRSSGIDVHYALRAASVVTLKNEHFLDPKRPPTALTRMLHEAYFPLEILAGKSWAGNALYLYEQCCLYAFQPKEGYTNWAGHVVFESPMRLHSVPDPDPPEPETAAP